MYILGIESTAHTFGVGIVENKKILANEKDVYKPKKGGMIPRDAALHHHEVAGQVMQAALKRADLKLSDIDAIAFSQGPGILAPLRVGTAVAKFLSSKNKKKLIGVNHCIAHIEIAKLCSSFSDPLMLYVSGGNTQVITFSKDYYRVFGETQDIGVGNLLDKFGRDLGLPFPAGPEIERLALTTDKYIELPYAIKGMDVSFSGIGTALNRLIKKYPKETLCRSLQETVFSMLIEASERTLAYCGKDTMVIAGGVAANKRLNEMGRIMCEERGAKFRAIPIEYAGDNGAMIAYTGYLMKDYNQMDLSTKPRFRTDTVEIKYR